MQIEALLTRVWGRDQQPEVVDVTQSSALSAGVSQSYLECLETDRDAHLYAILARHPGRTAVFCNAVSAVRRVAALLGLLGVRALPIHAQQQQRQRLKSLDRFTADEDAVLLATDVAARGLDIKGVRCVVHYQMPASLGEWGGVLGDACALLAQA